MENPNTDNKEKAAFPCTDGKTFTQFGLTKREHFAVLAMQGMLAGRTEYENPEIDVKIAIGMADKLIEALESDPSPTKQKQ